MIDELNFVPNVDLVLLMDDREMNPDPNFLRFHQEAFHLFHLFDQDYDN